MCQGEPQAEGKKGGGPTKQALLDTIQGLQKALERSRKECEAAVSSAKYMHVRFHLKKKQVAVVYLQALACLLFILHTCF